jgi:tryptophan synthase beta chain
MVKNWLNVRSLIPKESLEEIYKYENTDEYIKFHPELVVQHAVSTNKWIPIPQPVLDSYKMVGRNTPLQRAHRLEKLLNTTNKIYLKREDYLSNGSFKITSAIPQAYFGALEGKTKVITETGAGQTGVAAALASQINGLECEIFMVRSSYELKKLRRTMMEMFGAKVIASPSEITHAGKSLLSSGQIHGSIAHATSEVIESIMKHENSFNIAGSLLDFVLTYNTVVGLEVIEQLTIKQIEPDIVIGCVGGGSSFGGFAIPLWNHYRHRLQRVICTESNSIPTLTKGKYDYDHPDGEGKSNKIKMYSLGYDFKPPTMHASGLRYHAASPIVSYLVYKEEFEAISYDEGEAMFSAVEFARAEGMIPSPESSYTIHAIKEMCDKHQGRNIIALITGNGTLDLESYRRFI